MALLLGFIASAAPAPAATPAPDKAPVKSPAKTTRTYTPPVRTYTPPARTYTPPARTYTAPAKATKSPKRASKTSSHKRTKATSKHKKKAHKKKELKKKDKKKSVAAVTTTAVTTTAASTNTAKPITTIVSPEPAGGAGGSSGVRSAIASMLGAVMILLIGVGVLLLVLAAIDPYYLRPWRLRRTVENHRGDVAMGGLLLLVSLGVVYLISRSSAL